MASDQKIRVAIIGLGFGAEFIPIYQNYPGRRAVRDLPAVEERARRVRRPVRDQDPVHRVRAGPERPQRRRRPHQLADPRPRPAERRRAEGRQARRLHRADGHERRGVQGGRRGPAGLGQGLHDDGDGRLQPANTCSPRSFTRRANSAASSSSAGATSRTWTAGPTTGRASRRCGTPPTASAPAWRSWASTPRPSSCYGSGRIREELVGKYGSPFAVETATFSIKDSDVCAEVTRSLFDTARQYRESFDVYGSKKSFEWQQVEGEEPVIHTKGPARARDPRAGQGPRLRPPAPRADPAVHDQGRLQRRRRAAPLVHPGGRPRRLAPAPGPRLAQRDPRRTPRPARRRDLGQLDDGRPLRPRVGA